MGKILFITGLMCSLAFSANSQTEFFNNADLFFIKYVHGGAVDYRSIAGSPDLLNNLVNTIEHYELRSLTGSEKKAFLINTYNLLVIKNVLNHYPLVGPMEVDSFFDKKMAMVDGVMRSLNEIEKELLFPMANDPRLHFALVCAAKGCPLISNRAFMPLGLDYQLDLQTHHALNNPDFVRFDRLNHSVGLSQIFSWYAKDFGDNEAALEFVNRFREDKIPVSSTTTFYEYNWQLNNFNDTEIDGEALRD